MIEHIRSLICTFKLTPKEDFKKNLNFEQARHFCSKQDVQKQWSLAYVNFIKYFFLFSQPKGQRPLFEYLSFKPVKNPVITKLIFYLHEKGHEFGFNQNHGLRTPNEGIN